MEHFQGFGWDLSKAEKLKAAHNKLVNEALEKTNWPGLQQLLQSDHGQDPELISLLGEAKVLRCLVEYFYYCYLPAYSSVQSRSNRIVRARNPKTSRRHVADLLGKGGNATYLCEPFFTSAKWAEADFDALLVYRLNCEWDNMIKDGLASQETRGDDLAVVEEKLFGFVNWLRTELSPERWDQSLMPDILGIRVEFRQLEQVEDVWQGPQGTLNMPDWLGDNLGVDGNSRIHFTGLEETPNIWNIGGNFFDDSALVLGGLDPIPQSGSLDISTITFPDLVAASGTLLEPISITEGDANHFEWPLTNIESFAANSGDLPPEASADVQMVAADTAAPSASPKGVDRDTGEPPEEDEATKKVYDNLSQAQSLEFDRPEASIEAVSAEHPESTSLGRAIHPSEGDVLTSHGQVAPLDPSSPAVSSVSDLFNDDGDVDEAESEREAVEEDEEDEVNSQDASPRIALYTATTPTRTVPPSPKASSNTSSSKSEEQLAGDFDPDPGQDPKRTASDTPNLKVPVVDDLPSHHSNEPAADIEPSVVSLQQQHDTASPSSPTELSSAPKLRPILFLHRKTKPPSADTEPPTHSVLPEKRDRPNSDASASTTEPTEAVRKRGPKKKIPASRLSPPRTDPDPDPDSLFIPESAIAEKTSASKARKRKASMDANRGSDEKEKAATREK